MSGKNRKLPALVIAAFLASATACSSGKALVDGAVSASYTKIDDMENGGWRTEWAPSGLIPGPWFTATGCTEFNNISPVASASDLNNWSWSLCCCPHTLRNVSGSRKQKCRASSNHGAADGRLGRRDGIRDRRGAGG